MNFFTEKMRDKISHMASRISAENGTAEPAAVATKESSTKRALECCNYVQTGDLPFKKMEGLLDRSTREFGEQETAGSLLDLLTSFSAH